MFDRTIDDRTMNRNLCFLSSCRHKTRSSISGNEKDAVRCRSSQLSNLCSTSVKLAGTDLSRSCRSCLVSKPAVHWHRASGAEKALVHL